MSNATTLVYDPVAPCHNAPQSSRKALDTIAGKVVGFIDNSKPNFVHLVDDLAEVLTKQYGVAKVLRHRKRSASIGASEAVLNELGGECDAVITGSGD